MAYDEGLADLMAADLAETLERGGTGDGGDPPGLERKRMFGGMAFMLDGHMLCGVHKGGAMYRVGKPRVAAALAIEGAREMEMGGRVMGGMVEIDDSAMAEDATRRRLMALALENLRSLPPR